MPYQRCFSMGILGVLLALLVVAFLPNVLSAENVVGNLIVNSSFREGDVLPEGWMLVGKEGLWESFGRDDDRSVSVIGSGKDKSGWKADSWSGEENRLYYISLYLNRDTKAFGAGAGIVEVSSVNFDLWDLPNDGRWHFFDFIVRTPADKKSSLLVGQRGIRGKVSCDDVIVMPAFAVHKKVDDITLGAAERIVGGRYIFNSNFVNLNMNYARPLYEFTGRFDTDRWLLEESGQSVIFRHNIGLPFKSARVALNVLDCDKDVELFVEVSQDGKSWRKIGQTSVRDTYAVDLPDDFFPQDTVFVRISSSGRVQFNQYRLEAEITRKVSDAEGMTWYFKLINRSSDIDIQPVCFDDDFLTLKVGNKSDQSVSLFLSLELLSDSDYAQKGKASLEPVKVAVSPGEERYVRLRIPSLADIREQLLSLTVVSFPEEGAGSADSSEAKRGNIVFLAQVIVKRPWIELNRFGHIVSSFDNLKIWWAESTYKIGRYKFYPIGEANARYDNTETADAEGMKDIYMEIARNEYEPFQLVIRPEEGVVGPLRITLSPFRPVEVSEDTETVPCWDELSRIDYVPVSLPTDRGGDTGLYPDIIYPLWKRGAVSEGDRTDKGAVSAVSVEIDRNVLKVGENQPFWLVVYVPKNTSSGVYEAEITIEDLSKTPKEGARLQVKIPVRVRIFGFTLPDDKPLRTAYGVGIENAWHNLKSREQFLEVWDLYMQIFKRYNISPYSPYNYRDIKWKLIKRDNGEIDFEFDFSEFDKAMSRYLDEFGFDSFRMYSPPRKLAGYERFTPEWVKIYKKLIGPIYKHLEEKGWLDKAYFYWIDEPTTPAQYELTKRGMRILKELAPGIRRLLTNYIEKCPSPTFYGLVDLWCPNIGNYDPERAKERQALGEEVWWYVCCGPKWPCPNNFIDHPAITHRYRYWIAARFDLDGDLYWRVTYFTGEKRRLHNPYIDAQSRAPDGMFWGNGDGRLVYPPSRRVLGKEDPPVIAAPFASLRLALISEGIEDFTYIQILKDHIRKVEKTLAGDDRQDGNVASDVKDRIKAAKNLLDDFNRLIDKSVDKIINERDFYPTSPAVLYEYRSRIGKAIEDLRSLIEENN